MSDKNNSGLEVVGWITEWDADRYRMPGYLIRKTEPSVKHPCNRDIPLVRLSDAEAALESLTRDAMRYRWLRDSDAEHPATDRVPAHMLGIFRLKGDDFLSGGCAVSDYDETLDFCMAADTDFDAAPKPDAEALNAELVEALRGIAALENIGPKQGEIARAALLKAEGAKS